MKDFLISPDTTLIQAMHKLSESGEKGLVVVNKNKKLLGTLTDGDIRRKILKGIKINSTIKKIYNKNPIYLVEDNFTTQQAKNIFKNKNIDVLPIVNKKKYLVTYLSSKEILGNLKKVFKIPNISVVVMAGGKGLRLDPFTKILPKPLLPINDKPIIDHIIDKFVSYGIKNFFLTLNYKSKILKSYFEEKEKKSYSLSFFEEKSPLGTAGGLKILKNKLTKSFFVINCDAIINANYKDIYDFHQKNKNDVTIVASTKEFIIPYGICEINNQGLLLKIKEKPTYNLLANTGLYLISKKFLKLIPPKKSYDMNNFISDIKKQKGRVGVFPVDEKKWFDVGQWDEYQKTLKEFNFDNA